MNTDKKRLERNRFVRGWVGAGPHWPVVVVPGDGSPSPEGCAAYYTNARGNVVHHPNAYRRAWGKPTYHHSTRRVEVGDEWLATYGWPEELNARLGLRPDVTLPVAVDYAEETGADANVEILRAACN